MAVVVEDGTGVVDANSYFSTATADSYFIDRGVTAWALLDSDAKNAFAIRATETVEQVYGGRWQGAPVYAVQGLAWPRAGVVDRDRDMVLPWSPLPRALVSATLELAALIMTRGDLYAPVSQVPGGPVIERTIGPLTTRWAANETVNAMATTFVAPGNRIDLMLAPLLVPRTFGRTAIRA